ncbi:hypothetical protein ACQ4PT_034549 [Festuca glaucescens]
MAPDPHPQLLRRAALAPAATHPASAALSGAAAHSAGKDPVSPLLPPGFSTLRYGHPHSGSRSDPISSPPRDSPVSGSSFVPETQPAATAPSAPHQVNQPGSLAFNLPHSAVGQDKVAAPPTSSWPAVPHRPLNGAVQARRNLLCYRCLEKGHFSYECRDPVRCSFCRLQGHRAHGCLTRLRTLPPLVGAAPSPPPASRSAAAPAMPCLGDADSRPLETKVVFVSTPEMGNQTANLLAHAAVLWLPRGHPGTNAADVAKIISDQAGVPRDLFRVVPHLPENFLATFKHPHHRNMVIAALARYVNGDLDIWAAVWRLNAHRDISKLHQHVHLCLEGVPLNGWVDDLVSRIIGDDCIIDYFDVATLRKEDATTLNLWAWTSCPSKIPRRLTVIDAPAATFEVRALPPGHGRAGLEGRVLIHLDLIEDFTPAADGTVPHHLHISEPFRWQLELVDGERQARDRRDRAPPRDQPRRDDRDRRDRDREDDRGDSGRGRRDDRTWAGRLFHSRSRAPRDDGRGRDDRRDGQRRDASRDGRRHRASAAPGLDSRGRSPSANGICSGKVITPWCGSMRKAWNRSFSPATALRGGDTPTGLSPCRHILPSPPPLPSSSA